MVKMRGRIMNGFSLYFASLRQARNFQIIKFFSFMEKQKTATGRRKEAVTRIFLTRGSGKIVINDKDYKEYFSLAYLQNQVDLPLKATESLDKFDIKINATGGGIKGQAEACKLGIARALLEVNPELRPLLKAAGVLRRDPRSVERKKPGRKKARRSFQFSKR
jgi:small subunit ribosomal protein S9